MRKSELKFKLSELAFQVTQNAATEPPFTGEFFDFFEEGVSKLHPMTMSTVADSIEVHETTVSRAIANKFLSTPHGTFPFKYFFTPGYSGKDGDTVSNTSVKEIIGSIIEQEDSSKPLSDRKIVDLLAD